MRDTIRVYYLYISIATISNERGKENNKNIPVIRGSGARHIVHARTCLTASGYSNTMFNGRGIFGKFGLPRPLPDHLNPGHRR